eukprot:501041-Heterocapsa_arctica.AAC.1
MTPTTLTTATTRTTRVMKGRSRRTTSEPGPARSATLYYRCHAHLPAPDLTRRCCDFTGKPFFPHSRFSAGFSSLCPLLCAVPSLSF